MSLMIAGLYDALISAGAPEEKARAASIEVANFEERLQKISSDMASLKVLVGIMVALQLATFIKSFIG